MRLFRRPIEGEVHVRIHSYQHATRDETITFAEYMQLYSAVWKTSSPRTKAIRALPWGEHEGRWGGEKWDRARAFVEDFAAGKVDDPCPRALHWGGRTDTAHTRWEVEECGETANTFYTVPGFRGGDG